MKNINNNNDINSKINDIIDLYNNINDDTKLEKEISKKEINNNQEIKIIYNNHDKIQIFGDKFVSNNKDKVKILINDKKYDVSKYITLNPKQKQKKLFKLKLLGMKNVTNMSYMFYDCTSLNNIQALF